MVRVPLLHLCAIWATDGHETPSSFDQSARASATSFSLSGRSSSHTCDITRMLIRHLQWQRLPCHPSPARQ